MKIFWKMEHLLFLSKCSIFHNIFKSMIFQRHQKALLWSNGLTQSSWNHNFHCLAVVPVQRLLTVKNSTKILSDGKESMKADFHVPFASERMIVTRAQDYQKFSVFNQFF